MSALFLVSGVSKLGAPEQTKAYMEAYGVPGYLLYPAAALEIGSGGMLLADHHPVHTRWLAMVLAGWCLLTASIFHTDLKDQEQKINFMKNMAMAGGLFGPGRGRGGLGHEERRKGRRDESGWRRWRWRKEERRESEMEAEVGDLVGSAGGWAGGVSGNERAVGGLTASPRP